MKIERKYLRQFYLILCAYYFSFSIGSEMDQNCIRIVCHISVIYLPYICHITSIYLIRYMVYKWGIDGYEIRFHSDPILILFSSNSPLKTLSGYYSYQAGTWVFCVLRSAFSVLSSTVVRKSLSNKTWHRWRHVSIKIPGSILKQRILILTKGNTHLQILNLIEK